LQYLDTDFFTFSEEEIYINCGCYDGKDLLNFANITNNKYKFLVGIDTIKKNIEQTKNYLIKNNISNFKLLNNALGSSERTILVDQFADMSVLELKNEKNKEKIKQIILDSLKFDNKNFTFLSLDVEGYEIEVLKGASKVIETQKPKLAISIYHKPKHLIEVFKLLKDLNPEYKFSLQKIKNPGLYFTELILLAK
jgi:FkbM family methyltransferase